MKRFVYLIFAAIAVSLFNFAFVSAQEHDLTTDSLSVIIGSREDDSTKVNLMLERANTIFWAGKYEESLQAASEALALSLKIGFRKGEGKAKILSGQCSIRLGRYENAHRFFSDAVSVFRSIHNVRELSNSHLYLGQAYDFKAEYNKALAQYDTARQLANNFGDEVAIAKIMNSAGITNFNQGNYEIALENYLMALKTLNPEGNEKLHATMLNNVGVVYIQLSQYEDALKYFLKYVEFMTQLNGTHGLGVGYMNTGETYIKLRQLDKAIEYLTKALTIQSKTGDRKGLALTNSNLGDVYKALKEWNRAETFYDESIRLATEIRNNEVLLNPLTGASDLYLQMRSFTAADRTTNTAMDIAKRIGSQSWLAKIYLCKSRLDSARGDFNGAYSWFKRHSNLNDSLFNAEKSRQVFQMRELYESERKDKEIRLLSENNKLNQIRQANTKKVFTIYVVFLTAIIAVILYWLIQKTRLNRRLKAQKEEVAHVNAELQRLLQKIESQNNTLAENNDRLNELHQEKDALLGIVVHDLRSPLNRILGLSQLVKLSGDVNNEQQFMLDNIHRVCADANRLIGDLLELNEYESKGDAELKELDIKFIIHDQVERIRPELLRKSLQIKTEISEATALRVHTNSDYLHRIFDNLFSNAVKFSPTNAIIRLSISADANFVNVSIADQGPGFTDSDLKHIFQKFKKLSARPTGGESSTGLGLSIVKTLADKIHAHIEVKRNIEEGAELVVRVPRALEAPHAESKSVQIDVSKHV